MSWLLIFFLTGASLHGGGPATATFRNRDACETAGKAIEQKWPRLYHGHLCVSVYVATPPTSQ